MTLRTCTFALMLLGGSALAGERPAVLATLDGIASNWTDAQLRSSLVGGSDGEVVLGGKVAYAFEARQAGHTAFVYVSSHGDMTLLRQEPGAAKMSGSSETFTTTEPLGAETVYVVFSDQPLDTLASPGREVSLGDTGSAAQKFAAQVAAAQRQQKIAVSRLQYQLIAKSGGTQYTTRGIIRTIVEAETAAPGSATPPNVDRRTIPAHIEFALDSAELTRQGKIDLDTFGEALLSPELRDRSVRLDGHTDNTGEETYNCALSLRRAQAAQDYLSKSFGVPASRIEIAGFGESKPVASNDSEATRQKNRRVDFVFKSPGEQSTVTPTGCGAQ